MACLPAISVAWGSVFVGEHDGHHPLGDRRIAGVGGMRGEGAVVVVDLEQHLEAIDAQDGAVVLSVGIVIIAKFVERGDRLVRLIPGIADAVRDIGRDLVRVAWSEALLGTAVWLRRRDRREAPPRLP